MLKKMSSVNSMGNKSRITEKLDIYKQLKEHGQNRILVVDDEEFCIARMKSILMGAEIDIDNKVDFCINGKEAL